MPSVFLLSLFILSATSKPFILSVVMLNVVIVSVFMLSFVTS
jgi:hypothetical protein